MTVRKRSITINRHRTSFSIEQPFFDELMRIAAEQGLSLTDVVKMVDAGRGNEANLSSALRVFVLERLRAQASKTPPIAREI